MKCWQHFDVLSHTKAEDEVNEKAAMAFVRKFVSLLAEQRSTVRRIPRSYHSLYSLYTSIMSKL